jgi:RNA polymerase sigma-70 factor (ECF subfamily)
VSELGEAEARFIAALRRRDPRAFNALVTRFQDRIFALVLRLLGNPDDAREVAQEVFVTVFEKVDSYRGEAALSTWLYRVAVNHAKNRLKYRMRRRERQRDSYEELVHEPSSGRFNAAIPRPDELHTRGWASRLIADALAELDEEQRIIVVLRDVEGQSYEDIATITGLQLGTVKSRLHRARTKLKGLLAPHIDAGALSEPEGSR